MAGGRPPKPTALKVLSGTARPDRINANEPVVPAGDVRPPAWLRGKGRAAWRRLVLLLQGMRVLTVADCEDLALGCDALGEYIELRAFIRENGRTYTTTTVSGDTMYRPRPEVAMAADAWRKADHILSQFGLNPSARSKVSAIVEEERDPFAEFLKGNLGG